MAGQTNHRGTILPQDSGLEADFNDLGIPEALSQSEIEEFLSNDERPASERLERLKEFRDELRSRSSADVADSDTSALLREVENTIAQLGGLIEERDSEDEDFLAFDTVIGGEPGDHSETLAPDDDERADREDQELESLWEDLDEDDIVAVPTEDDGPTPERGVN
jgi:hypothetical protein